jgi:death-on-curing protein
MQPVFLNLTEVLALHQESIDRYGGDPSIRDIALLLSALAMPAATFGGQFLHEDLAAMAAAYLFHIVGNHAFVDGNKRTGAAASRVFLLMNNAQFDPPEDEFEAITLAVASGKATKAEVTTFFKKYVR